MTASPDGTDGGVDSVLDARGLVVRFKTRRGTVEAVGGIDLTIAPTEVLGLVGESGCGKSTTGRAIAQLVRPTEGSVRLDGVELAGLRGTELRRARARMPIVFQDPRGSMNPRRRVVDVVAEPLRVRGVPVAERRAAAEVMLEEVGIDLGAVRRYPHEFSGGQAQRVAIARALVSSPRVVICDEPVSALDVSIQAQIVNLLVRLREQRGLAMLFISHDLSVVQLLSDRVAVMYLGKICEIGPARAVFERSAHHYTHTLVSSVPVADPRLRRPQTRMVRGEMPSPLNPPSGCRFRTRCPAATSICANENPQFSVVGDDHVVACHHPRGSGA
ncbi:MAG TPA: oligopeptide/dipeptide ABC transporter ATP-binding protein [Ilumatobacter sp.]|nr:oligopeptide/dipeptide ABC transporter ATP-binding protein [Ilumatobacter sp.]